MPGKSISLSVGRIIHFCPQAVAWRVQARRHAALQFSDTPPDTFHVTPRHQLCAPHKQVAPLEALQDTAKPQLSTHHNALDTAHTKDLQHHGSNRESKPETGGLGEGTAGPTARPEDGPETTTSTRWWARQPTSPTATTSAAQCAWS